MNEQTVNNFLPTDYKQVPASNSNYMKFQDGLNKVRIMSSAIVGWEYWNNENKPIRSKEYPKETIGIRIEDNGKPTPIKHFWAFTVWDYADKKVKILEITQKGIMRAVKALVDNPDWGDPKQYDLAITRQGEGLNTEYTVMPSPAKELPMEAAEAYAKITVNLTALYDGQDPFVNPDKF